MLIVILGLYSVMVYSYSNQQPNNTTIEVENNELTKNDNVKLQGKFIKVGCTVYNPMKSQCDDTPNVTYDSTKIDAKRASGYRYIGVSHDLVKMGFEMGTLVMVIGLDDYYDGVWEVRDLMHKKWKHKIDFLQARGHKLPPEQICIIVKVEKPVVPDSILTTEGDLK